MGMESEWFALEAVALVVALLIALISWIAG